jgi:hypothetical protein
MRKLYNDVTAKKNIYKIQKYFDDFVKSQNYKMLSSQLKSDVEIIELHCSAYSDDISLCSSEITK